MPAVNVSDMRIASLTILLACASAAVAQRAQANCITGIGPTDVPTPAASNSQMADACGIQRWRIPVAAAKEPSATWPGLIMRTGKVGG